MSGCQPLRSLCIRMLFFGKFMNLFLNSGMTVVRGLIRRLHSNCSLREGILANGKCRLPLTADVDRKNLEGIWVKLGSSLYADNSTEEIVHLLCSTCHQAVYVEVRHISYSLLTKQEPFITEMSEWRPSSALSDPLPPPAAAFLCCSCQLCKQTDRTVAFKGYGVSHNTQDSSWRTPYVI